MQEKCDVPIWVLNLKRDEEKRRFMESQLDGFGNPYQIIEAVDGRALKEEEMAAYSKNMALINYGRELTPGEIGCAFSHIHMWKLILTAGLDEVLILEDDIHIGKALFDVINNRYKMPKDYQLINLSTEALQIPFGEFITDIYRVSNHAEKPYSTGAYLITKQGAKFLLDLVAPIYMPIDNFICVSGIKSYGIFPKVVVNAEIQSSIGRRSYNMPEPGFFLRKYRQFKDIIKAVAFFFGASPQMLISIHLKINRSLEKLKNNFKRS